MSRRTTLASLAGALLLGSAAPALAGPVTAPGTERETVCLRTDGSGDPTAKGICVWVPFQLPITDPR